jgi:hypothetical protein
VLAGDSARAAQEITAEAGSAGLTPSRRTGADACVRYLNARHEYLRYGQALAEGWPIATGVIEGACRHLIADRLDIGGARWELRPKGFPGGDGGGGYRDGNRANRDDRGCLHTSPPPPLPPRPHAPNGQGAEESS